MVNAGFYYDSGKGRILTTLRLKKNNNNSFFKKEYVNYFKDPGFISNTTHMHLFRNAYIRLRRVANENDPKVSFKIEAVFVITNTFPEEVILSILLV